MAIVVLSPLSAPAQFVAKRGVTEYLHEPGGTEPSMQVVAATMPEHAERIVWSASVVASYRLI
jgi:hypothetical protein